MRRPEPFKETRTYERGEKKDLEAKRTKDDWGHLKVGVLFSQGSVAAGGISNFSCSWQEQRLSKI
jgi:hypothetical protein